MICSDPATTIDVADTLTLTPAQAVLERIYTFTNQGAAVRPLDVHQTAELLGFEARAVSADGLMASDDADLVLHMPQRYDNTYTLSWRLRGGLDRDAVATLRTHIPTQDTADESEVYRWLFRIPQRLRYTATIIHPPGFAITAEQNADLTINTAADRTVLSRAEELTPNAAPRTPHLCVQLSVTVQR